MTRLSRQENGRRTWKRDVDVYYVADPPTHGLTPAKGGVPPVPERWEPLND